jgi:metal-responsive CopG/Arc/MetJ family transcriptional regulator
MAVVAGQKDNQVQEQYKGHRVVLVVVLVIVRPEGLVTRLQHLHHKEIMVELELYLAHSLAGEVVVVRVQLVAMDQEQKAVTAATEQHLRFQEVQ